MMRNTIVAYLFHVSDEILSNDIIIFFHRWYLRENILIKLIGCVMY